jgi:hypothetical protein
MDSAVLSSNREIEMNATTTTQAAETETETETWEAWLDGDRDEAVQFEVPLTGWYDVAEAGASALGIDVCEKLNVARV